MRSFAQQLAFLTLPMFVAAIGVRAEGQEPKALPKVVLVGDSIRMGYESGVAKQLEGKAIVFGPKANCGDSNNVAKNLDAWVIKQKPDLVHFNCGIHDTKKFPASGKFQVSPEQYEANLRTIVERLRKETSATIVFATTTPILTGRALKARAKAEYELSDESVERFNAIARKVMADLKVPVNDLNGVFADKETREKMMTNDGVHFSPAGSARLATAVSEFVTKHLPAAK